MATLQEQVSSLAARIAQEFNTVRAELVAMKDNILGDGVSEAYDTIKEVADKALANKELIDELTTNANAHVAYTSQSKTENEKSTARTNIGAISDTELSTHNNDSTAHSALRTEINNLVSTKTTEFGNIAQTASSNAILAQTYAGQASSSANNASSSAANAAASATAASNTASDIETRISNVITEAEVVKIQNINSEGTVTLLTDEDLTTINNNLATKLPLSGGTMTGDVLFSSDKFKIRANSGTTHELSLHGGASHKNGSSLYLHGKEQSGQEGWFHLVAHNGTTEKALIGKPTGVLTWDNNEVLTTNSNLNAAKLTGTASINITGKATTAGTADSALTCSGNSATTTKLANSVNINNVAFDGTANITVEDDTKLPLSGGTITGTITKNGGTVISNIDNATGYMAIDGKGASIQLYPKTHGSTPSQLNIGVRNTADSANIWLQLKHDGSATWNSKSISTIESSDTGYIRYTNGIQICWGSYNQTNSAWTSNSFPVKFISEPSVTLTALHTSTDTADVSKLRVVTLGEVTVSGFKCLTGAVSSAGVLGTNSGVGGKYMAIGYWK